MTLRRPITVLLTCVGGALSTDVIRAMAGQAELPLRIIGADSNAQAVRRHAVETFYQVPAGTDPAYTDALLDICRTERVQVIIPRADEEAEAIAAARGRFESIGVRCAVPDQATVRLLRHKGRMFDALCAAGIDMPRYRTVTTGEDLKTAVGVLGFPRQPLVIKPCVARGGRGVIILNEAVRWDEVLAAWESAGRPQLLVMEYLPGPAYDVDLVSQGGKVLCLGIRRRYNPAGTPFMGCVTESDDRIERKARAVAFALRLESGGDIDLASSADGVPHVLEVNPRVSGGVIGSMRAGVNIPLELVKLALGWPVAEQVARPGVDTPSPYRLRAATAEDAHLLWAWANDPATRRQAFQEAQIPWEAHRTWFDRKLADQAGCLLAILESDDGAAVGQIRFDQAAAGLEVDLSLGAEHRGKRLGHELLRQGLQRARERWPVGTRVAAHVLDGNGASRRVFARGGFVSAGRRQIQGKACERWERKL